MGSKPFLVLVLALFFGFPARAANPTPVLPRILGRPGRENRHRARHAQRPPGVRGSHLSGDHDDRSSRAPRIPRSAARQDPGVRTHRASVARETRSPRHAPRAFSSLWGPIAPSRPKTACNSTRHGCARKPRRSCTYLRRARTATASIRNLAPRPPGPSARSNGCSSTAGSAPMTLPVPDHWAAKVRARLIGAAFLFSPPR